MRLEVSFKVSHKLLSCFDRILYKRYSTLYPPELLFLKSYLSKH